MSDRSRLTTEGHKDPHLTLGQQHPSFTLCAAPALGQLFITRKPAKRLTLPWGSSAFLTRAGGRKPPALGAGYQPSSAWGRRRVPRPSATAPAAAGRFDRSRIPTPGQWWAGDVIALHVSSPAGRAGPASAARREPSRARAGSGGSMSAHGPRPSRHTGHGRPQPISTTVLRDRGPVMRAEGTSRGLRAHSRRRL